LLQAGGVPSGFRNAAKAAEMQKQAKLFAVKSPSRNVFQVIISAH